MGKKLPKLWRIISDIETIQSILQWIGISKLISGGGTTAMIIWSVFEHKPTPEIVIIAIATFAVLLWLSNLLVGLWRRKKVDSASKVQKPIKGTLSQEQVAERLAFIQHLRTVAERLFKNTKGAENQSIYFIVRDICKEEPIREYIVRDNLASQTLRFLTRQLDDLFTRTSNYHRYTKELSVSSLDEATIHSLCNTTSELILDYRRLVDETMKMFDNLESRGVRSLWRENSWAPRIHGELADNYDELMRLVVDLKKVTPSDAGDLLPKDDQTSKFPRTSPWWLS